MYMGVSRKRREGGLVVRYLGELGEIEVQQLVAEVVEVWEIARGKMMLLENRTEDRGKVTQEPFL